MYTYLYVLYIISSFTVTEAGETIYNINLSSSSSFPTEWERSEININAVLYGILFGSPDKEFVSSLQGSKLSRISAV